MKRVNKHLDGINMFCENRSRIKSRNWKQSLCRSKSVFFCVSIRSNLPEEGIFVSFLCLWNKPIVGLTNPSQVGMKTQFGQGSCYVAIRNASKDPRGIRKNFAMVISKPPCPSKHSFSGTKKGQDRRALITFLLTFQGWVNPQSISESLLKSHQQMK